MTNPNVIIACAGQVRSALSAARKLAGVDLKSSRELLRSGGEDGLYRCHLANGMIVEVTVLQYAPAVAKWQF